MALILLASSLAGSETARATPPPPVIPRGGGGGEGGRSAPRDWLQDLNERKAQSDAEDAARRAEEAAKRQKALHRALYKVLWNHSARVIQVCMRGIW